MKRWMPIVGPGGERCRISVGDRVRSGARVGVVVGMFGDGVVRITWNDNDAVSADREATIEAFVDDGYPARRDELPPELRFEMERCAWRGYIDTVRQMGVEGRSEETSDPFTECDNGHPQLACADCDGHHCYRSCDEIARAECRARHLR